MDDREKESEVEERVEVTEEGLRGERRRRLRNFQLLRKLWKKKRGVKKIQSAILQPREPGCVQLLLTVRKFPLWNL